MWSSYNRTFDLYPTSSTAGYYADKLDAAARRQLAGPEDLDQPNNPVNRLEDYVLSDKEIEQMEQLDDAAGTGIFDRGKPPNTHVGGGMFAKRLPWPGYLQREVPGYPSPEVMDVNTGRPMVYVPAGMVGLDTAAQIAMLEKHRYPVKPLIGPPSRESAASPVDIAEVAQYGKPIGTFSTENVPWAKLGVALAAGLLVGAVFWSK